MSKDEKFNFFMPLDIEKAKDKRGKQKMLIKGIASTNDKDSQGEILEASGFDLSYFKKAGYFNWHHQAKNNPSAIIGEPTDAKITNKGLYVEGELYSESALAKSVYKLADTLQKSGSKRRLGFSIEGKAIERDPVNPKRITKARINHVAITHAPINGNTLMDVIKGECDEQYVGYEFDGEEIREDKVEKSNDFILDIIKGNEHITLDKDFNIKIKKGTTAEGMIKDGRTKESLEGSPKTQTYGKNEDERAQTHFKLSKADWDKLSDDEKDTYRKKLPKRQNKQKEITKAEIGIAASILIKANKEKLLSNDILEKAKSNLIKK